MASVNSYSSTGAKSATKVTLDKNVFGVEVKNHELLRQAYQAFLANKRVNLAKTKTRGEVAGSTKKPWKQKGTGRARFGSRYNPIWKGGGITFGPTGNENYSKKINVKAKRLAVRQALSLSAGENKVKVIDSFVSKDGKAKTAFSLLKKIDSTGKVLIIVDKKDEVTERSVRNIPDVKLVTADYLNVFSILNSDSIVVTKKALDGISENLTAERKVTPKKKSEVES